MAASLQSAFTNKGISRLILATAVLLACSVAQAQDLKSYILAARRSGAIEIIDPASLVTIGRIHFPVSPKSTGLNGVHAAANGVTLYVEGPIPNEPNLGAAAGGCCVLYSIDLATLETRQVAGVPGTASRQAFVTSGGITYPAAAPRDAAPRFPRGADEVFESAQMRILSGMWMDGRDFLYGAKEDGSEALLWSGSPDATELGQGVAVEPFAKVPGCSSHVQPALVGAAGNLFLYEMFGWIGDRRTSCSGVPGGAWVVDPSSGTLLAHVAPDLYFSELVADREEGELYGVSVADPDWLTGVKLVRIDAVDGSILQSRVLESDFWRISFAPLRIVPAADVRALLPRRRR
jgi:hypothetical protein